MADAMKLLPCPFDGEEAIECWNRDAPFPMYWVQCRKCHACPGGSFGTPEYAIEAWNRRASPTSIAREKDLAVLLDNLVISQSLSRELRTAATDEARAYLYEYRRAASPPAREEAPAEGAGESHLMAFLKTINMSDLRLYQADIDHALALDRAPPPNSERIIKALRKGINHLRGRSDSHTIADRKFMEEVKVEVEAAALSNRTSEPEAGFLGHLVTPKGGDAVFIPKGERIPLISQGGSVTPIYDGPQNVTAPATDDKLRVAVEALERIERRRQTGAYDEVEAWELQDIARQALAALNEQPQ